MLTLDTGALIALERGDKRMRARRTGRLKSSWAPSPQRALCVQSSRREKALLARGALQLPTGGRGDVPRKASLPDPTEWWRGTRGRSRKLLEAFEIEPLGERIALLAGEALAHVRGPSIADAIVMASAAQRGDLVVTADFEDLDRLRAHFPGVRLIALQSVG